MYSNCLVCIRYALPTKLKHTFKEKSKFVDTIKELKSAFFFN